MSEAPAAGSRWAVAHVVTRLDLGGAQQNTLHCVRSHDRGRFDVHLIAGAGGVLDAEARALADAHVRLDLGLVHPIAPRADAVAVVALARYFREQAIDLVHTHSSKAGILGRAAAFVAGVPAIVHTVHGWSFNATQPRHVRAGFIGLERAAAQVTDRLLVVARRHADDGLARGIGRRDQYRVVRSGIDPTAFDVSRIDRDAVRRRLGWTAGEIVVGTLSALKPQKAPLDFVRAAAAAAARDERLRFYVAGDGELRDAAERLARERGLGQRLRFLGWRHDAADLLAATDVFLLTSRFEGLPRAVLQAFAAGVPVVATAVDGTPEVVEHGASGLLVPPDSPEEAARSVLALAADPALRVALARGARARLDSEFDIRRMVAELDALYAALLAAKHVARRRRVAS